jgi:ATP-dependent helicase/nuclease subunit B
MRTTVLIAPSMAAVVELPRRLAMAGNAVSGVYAFKLPDLARALAEPALLGRGLLAWDGGQDALLAARLLADDPGGGFHLAADLPRGPVAATLARTLAELRRSAATPESIEALAREPSVNPEDQARLRTLARLYRAFHAAREGRVADPNTLLRTATERVADASWLQGAEVVVVEDIEAGPLERGFLAAIARVAQAKVLGRPLPAALVPSSFRAWASTAGIREARWGETVLAPLAPPAVPVGLERLRKALFEPPEGAPVTDGTVELITAPGEAAEARAVVRRLLRAARDGIAFEDMGVIVPRPEVYAPLFADLFSRLGIPHRLHPSLPLRFGRAARSLLLLFRCRGLTRSSVMEFLTFAPIPFAEMLGEEATPEPSRWDALSRDAGIVSGLDRWMIGLRAHAEAEREAAAFATASPDQRERRRARATDADELLRVVELLSTTLDGLAGEASWAEWSAHLFDVCERWIGNEQDREAVLEVVADLGGLGSVSARAEWADVERVVEARFEWERVPMSPPSTGGVHVGVFDAMAGLPFRLVVIPGLVEGGYPGVLRPDPFLLDGEREALARATALPPLAASGSVRARRAPAQLGLFDNEVVAPSETLPPALPTTQDRLQQERRHFHRAVSQATAQLVLSYPRADPRSGRERLPSLFYVAVASALEGKAVSAADLDRLVVEDDLERLPLEDAVDRTERDRVRIHREGKAAAGAIAAGSAFFKQSRLAAQARWSGALTRYDGLLTDLDPEALKKLDPLNAAFPISASRLATYSRCGFLYLLQYVLRLEPALEPEERKRLEPLERGSLFHEVAERFLRERRERGELPVRDSDEMRLRLLAMAEESLEALVAGSPPRFRFLWEREKERVRTGLLDWLRREAQNASRSTPAHFEVSFGLGRSPTGSEAHDPSPMLLDLGDGRTLRVSGQIDRIDERPDGTLVLRDYKTGKAPKDEGGIFRGGKQLQIPFYILAAAKLFPGQPVVEAFLDYVDGGRQVAVDPDVVRSEGWKALLRGLVDSIAQGVFVQEPTACEWCDFTAVCGPRPLLERRRQIKRSDPQLIRVLRLRDMG